MPTLNIPLKWTVSISANDLKQYLEAQERLKPCVFIIPAKYSSQLEFGTGPMDLFLTDSEKIQLRRDIRTWLRRKKGVTDKRELDTATNQVVNSLLTRGMRARPYWRPAFYLTSDNLQQLFDQGYSLMDIITWMSERVNDNIMYNRYAPPGGEYMPDTGTLQSGWIIRYLTDEEVRGARTATQDVNAIADRIWTRAK